MKLIIFIVILGITVYRYIRFKQDYKFYQTLVHVIATENFKENDFNHYVRLGSALMMAQRYKDAYESFKMVEATIGFIPQSIEAPLKMNMAFCQKPCPGTGLENLNGSFIHNGILKRLGGARTNLVTNEDILNAQAYLRLQEA